MSGGLVSVPVSASKPPAAERPRNPRTIPKTRTGRQADPRRGPHQGPGGASLPAPSIRSGQNPGYPRSLPKNKQQTKVEQYPGKYLSRAIPSGAGGKPEAPAKAANEGAGRGRRGGEKKGGGKPKSRKAGKSRETEKPGSRKAEKRAEAQKGIKKRRRTVGCTSACGPLRSLAYRNYLLR